MKQTDESKDAAIEAIRLNLVNSQNKPVKSDDPKIAIAEMQINALLQMCDDENEIFSQIHDSEVFDVSRAIVFSRSCLPSLEKRLKAMDIEISFKLPVLEAFIKENFRHKHKIGRQRVLEFLRGLEAVSPKIDVLQQADKKLSFMDRLR